MAESKTEAKQHGLRLDLPGASREAHTVAGVPGWFWRESPTPVGGSGEVTLARARELDKDPGVPLRLVQISPAEAVTRRREIADWRGRVRRELRNVSPLTADEAERRTTEQRAAAGKD